MKLIFVRHGQTIGNITQTHQGQSDGELTKLGIEQAKKVGERLKDWNFDYIFCSDLGRVVNTAKEIIKFHPKIPVEYVKDLRELYLCADWHGKPHQEIKEYIKKYGLPKGAEGFDGLKKRIENFLKLIYKKHRNDTVLFIAHGGVGQALLLILRKLEAEQLRNQEKLENTSISIFEVDNDNYKILTLNEISHLN